MSKRRTWPHYEVFISLDLLFAMYRAWQEEWGKVVFMLICAALLIYWQYREEARFP